MPEFAGDHRLKEAALAHSAAFLGVGPRAEQIGAESTKRRRVLAQRCAVLPILRPDGGPFLVRTFLHSVRVQGGGSTPRPSGRTEPCRTATLRGMDLVREVNRLGGLIPAGYHVIRVSHWQLTHDWPTVQALITGAIARGLHERPATDPRSIVDSTQIRG